MLAQHVILVGYAKQALRADSRERQRMKLYAEAVSELHVVALTNQSENFASIQQDGNLLLYATNSTTNFKKIFDGVRLIRKIINSTKEKQSWVVSSQDPFETAFIVQLATLGTRATQQAQVHGDIFNPVMITSVWQRLRVIYAKYILRLMPSIRVVSERIKKSLVSSGVSEDKIVVLPIITDLKQFLLVGEDRRYGTTASDFLYVGRLAPEKNLELLIEAFELAASKNANLNLTLLGDGSEKTKIEELVIAKSMAEKIKIIPWTDNVAEVMKRCDVLCLTSNHEGWGMVLLEAAAAGLPVITTDVGCVGECIKHNQHGLVVDKTAAKVAAAITDYASNAELVEQHGRAGHELGQAMNKSAQGYVQKMVEGWSSGLL